MVCFGTPSAAVADVEASAHEPPWLMRGPLVVLAAVTLFGGLVLLSPQVLVDPSDPDTEFLHPEIAVTATLAVLVVIGLVYAGWRRSGRRDPAGLMPTRVREFCAREAGFDEGYDRAFARPTSRLADGVVANDRDVVEPYVRGSAFAARGMGAVLRLAQNGNVQVYLSAAVVGAVLVVVAVAAVAGVVGA
jgi:NADH-quinone oxidoreductase subunit L